MKEELHSRVTWKLICLQKGSFLNFLAICLTNRYAPGPFPYYSSALLDQLLNSALGLFKGRRRYLPLTMYSFSRGTSSTRFM